MEDKSADKQLREMSEEEAQEFQKALKKMIIRPRKPRTIAM